MKQFLTLLALFALFLTATLTFGHWFPWLQDSGTSTAISTLGMLLDIAFKAATVLLGIATFLGWRRSREAAPSPPLRPESTARYVQKRAYEPTPIDPSAPALEKEQSPYLGLGAFQCKDAHLFFGRHRETREALAWLGSPLSGDADAGHQTCRWLQIEGNSGAGKSSLVNAGMLPLVEQGVLRDRTGFGRWRVIGPMMPGEHPLRRLAEALEQAFVSDPEQRDTLDRQKRLESDERALAYSVNDRKDGGTAFLLVVDQFEELFTFAGREQKLQFDRQLACALNDAECPLFVISTVRIDYLDGFERLPGLSELYNTRCKRYLLKTISREGLREAIEGPAKLAGLDVNEVTTAMLRDASGEAGALPLVENALQYLWEHREGDRLSGALYEEKGGIAGLLESQADALLARLGRAVPGGRGHALELLLALTRVSDQGNHTRRRLSLHEARLAAGGKRRDEQRGQAVIDYLSGKPGPHASPGSGAQGGVRLVSVSTDGEADAVEGPGAAPAGGPRYVDLIHETLIRMRGKDAVTGRRIGYWRTLYDYIEKNRDRGFYRDQLSRKAGEWRTARGLRRWRGLAGWGDLLRYRHFHPARGEPEYRYKQASLRVAWIQAGVLAGLLLLFGQSYVWTLTHGLPPGYMLMQQKFRLMDRGLLDPPWPETVAVPAPHGEFRVGERDEAFAEQYDSGSLQYLGYPATAGEIGGPFEIGRFEVTYDQYDYYVWRRRGTPDAPDYPDGAPDGKGRGSLPVVNVTWHDANAYLAWLSEETGEVYRLPTEAEWEYAARAGTDTAYWWGDEVRPEGEARANCDGCGSDWDNRTVAPVGSFAANRWDLHDTAGNVWEWTCSRWAERFDGSESSCADPDDATGARVIRGGSSVLIPGWERSSSRYRYSTDSRNDDLGFRVLRAARTP